MQNQKVCLRTSSPAPHGLLCQIVCSSHQMAVCGFVNSNALVKSQPQPKTESTKDSEHKK